MPGINLQIFSPSKLAYSNEVTAVTVPGTKGTFQVLRNHAPLISTFEIGTIKIIVNENNILYFSAGGGTIEVLNNNVKILADSLEAVEEIDIDRARNALKRAEERLANKNVQSIDVNRAEAAQARADNRIKIYEKYFEYKKSQ